MRSEVPVTLQADVMLSVMGTAALGNAAIGEKYQHTTTSNAARVNSSGLRAANSLFTRSQGLAVGGSNTDSVRGLKR